MDFIEFTYHSGGTRLLFVTRTLRDLVEPQDE